MSLDRLITSARETEIGWTPDRSARVLAGAIQKKETRARRGCFVAPTI
jgi:hypothetical protein